MQENPITQGESMLEDPSSFDEKITMVEDIVAEIEDTVIMITGDLEEKDLENERRSAEIRYEGEREKSIESLEIINNHRI